MRQRPSSRLLVISPENRVLLFRFTHKTGALQGQEYWATPGGGVEPGETFEQAAIRELYEEVGITARNVGAEHAQRVFEMQLPDGEWVMADERFFIVHSPTEHVSDGGWTAQERLLMTQHRWWSREALQQTSALVFPQDLLSILGLHLS
ncbi:NUDIX domain-containing protein [Pseudomonas sp. 7P_10.2_Bac1]|uniref:NUDIX hydrolase n=1 Tax=Pseudomonas sp. 7P_10.2_Bac1 TaxID=2971614 RepID=UPI0021C5B4D8|nr:NUDIX domain-containing protein [Pseudomonas sp. 7P_10.2_Bac1]MCU1725454.1 NUDIX domain-containing protein [Pseudomonas sp. 7P_10.2_Bac1]